MIVFPANEPALMRMMVALWVDSGGSAEAMRHFATRLGDAVEAELERRKLEAQYYEQRNKLLRDQP